MTDFQESGRQKPTFDQSMGSSAWSARSQTVSWPEPCGGSRAAAVPRPVEPIPPFTPGTSIQGGRYDLVRLIGKGGMGWVFEALDRQRGHSVALKILRAPGPAREFRLKREFRALADLRHPNLVRMHELGREGDTAFVTMELVDGVDFENHVRPAPERRLDCDRLRSALGQLVGAVRALHDAGKLHRDLKPSNVLVDREGRVVVLDFGLVHEAETYLFAPEPGWAGTPGFMAPEQARGSPAVAASDWYSVGAMLHLVLTGEPPISEGGVQPGPALPQLKLAGVSDELVELTRALLDPTPDRRPVGDEVAARLGLERPGPAPRLRAVEDLVGRTEQLAMLGESLARVQSGVPARVLITGPAGIGKTALVGAFLDAAVREGALALAGKCHERDSVPYKALDTIVDELSRYLQHLPARELSELVTPDLSALLQVFPVLGRVPELRAHQSAEYGSDPAELRQRALASLKEMLRRIGQSRTLLLFIDDLQWGDLDSARLLTRLMAPPDAPRLLLLAAYRDTGSEAGRAVQLLLRGSGVPGDPARTEHCVVRALTQDEARELCARLLAPHEIPEGTCRALASESAGNPLFVTELARSWLESASAVAGDAEPPSFASLLCKRIARLPEAAAELLELTVVASRPPRIDVLHRALSNRSEALWPVIDLLKAERFVQGLATDTCESIALCHDRIRETVDGTLAARQRVELHRRLADAISAVTPDEHDQLLEHLLGAGLTAPAGECAARAGDASSCVLAFDNAAQFYRQAIALLAPARSDDLGLRRKLADVLAAAARCNEAAAVYLELGSRTHDDHERAELFRCAAVQALAGGDKDTGVATFVQLFAVLGLRWPSSAKLSSRERASHALRALLLNALAMSSWQSRVSRQREERLGALMAAAECLVYYDRRVAYRLMLQFVTRALLGGGPAMRAHACVTLANASIAARGPSATVLRLVRRAGELAVQAGDSHALAASKNTLALARLMLGEYAEAESLADSAEQLTRSVSAARVMHKFSRELCISAQFWQGKLRSADRGLTLMLSDARERGHTFDKLDGDRAEAERCQLDRGSLQAEPMLRHAECIVTPGPGWRWEWWLKMLAAIYCGDLAYAAELEARLSQDPLWSHLGRSQLLYARALLALATTTSRTGLDSVRRATAERSVRSLEQLNLASASACATLVRAGLAAFDGQLATVRARLARGADQFFACGMLLHAHCARRALGIVTGSAGLAWVADADAFLREQAVADCERWTYCHVPAFERMRRLSSRSRNA